eukprot:m51a1_g10185 hypothetical protein (147) ;mRNA; f:90276-93302
MRHNIFAHDKTCMEFVKMFIKLCHWFKKQKLMLKMDGPLGGSSKKKIHQLFDLGILLLQPSCPDQVWPFFLKQYCLIYNLKKFNQALFRCPFHGEPLTPARGGLPWLVQLLTPDTKRLYTGCNLTFADHWSWYINSMNWTTSLSLH